VLVVTELHKKYGAFVAVDSVSFRINDGEVYGLLGPNGAGKSSTIKVLSCLAKPDGGHVQIDGLDIVEQQAQVKTRIGIVPQDIALYDDFSARENLEFFGRLYGMRGADLRKRSDELLEAVGLLERGKDHVGSFSGGMKRRINIAAGLMHRPKMLYLDEPTVGIDPQSRRLILDLVKRLNTEGLTVLFTTHYMEEAEELCHRIGIIDFGKIIAEGTREGRHFTADAHPEAGHFFRSDHFSMAKVGVPAVSFESGLDLIAGGTARGEAIAKDYVTRMYHQPADEWQPDWDFSGMVADAQVLHAVGLRLANSREWPNWSKDSEFRAARDKTGAARN